MTNVKSRLQFSLRALLVGTAVVGVCCGFQVNRARQQHHAVIRLQQLGYIVLYSQHYDGTLDPSNALSATWGKRSQSRGWMDRGFFDWAVIVYVGRQDIVAAIPYLRLLPHLEEVSISAGGTCISGRTKADDLIETQQLNQLRRDLPHVKISYWTINVVG